MGNLSRKYRFWDDGPLLPSGDISDWVLFIPYNSLTRKVLESDSAYFSKLFFVFCAQNSYSGLGLRCLGNSIVSPSPDNSIYWWADQV